MRRKRFTYQASLAAGLLLLLFAAPARAQDAAQHQAAATTALARGDFASAAEELTAAYALAKDPALLLQIGDAYDHAGAAAKAVDYYRQYVAALPDAFDRQSVDERVAELSKKLGVAAPASPTATPAPAVEAAPATAPEAAPAASATPAAGDEKSAPATACNCERGEQPMSGMHSAGIIGMAVSLVLLGGGAVLGLAAKDRANVISGQEVALGADGARAEFTAAQEQAVASLRSDGQVFNGTGIALMTLSGAVAVASTLFLVADAVRGTKAAEASRLTLAPSFSPTGAGLAAALRF